MFEEDDSLRNRMHNLTNPYQGERKKVLCLCSAGLLRSPTAAWLLGQQPYDYNTRAAGTESFALIRADRVLCEWADEIIAMTPRHVIHEYAHKTVVLNVPDIHGYRAPELIEAIREQYDANREHRAPRIKPLEDGENG